MILKMNVSETIEYATHILDASGLAEPRREANSLLAFALGKDRTFLIAHPEYQLSSKEETRFREILQRRANREPFQYIIGKQEFFGLDFEIASGVLIPRPETELIVENAIEILRRNENPFFCEIGVGSGCISVSILKEVTNARAIGVDVSEIALRIAKKNTENHKVSVRIDLRISDLFDALQKEQFDLIVSNPPYISAEDFEDLQLEVKDFEPRNALTDGKDGLSIVENLVAQTPNFLKPGGFLLMEIGFDQANEVRKMFSSKIWKTVEILPDLQDIPRTVKAQIRD